MAQQTLHTTKVYTLVNTTLTSPLNIVFAGTPDFAAQHLNALLISRHNVLAVYTQPDRPAGRGKKISAGPVKALAQANSIPVQQPRSLKSEEEQHRLATLECDLMIVVAYGLILPQTVLDIPRYGCLNVHGSLLPRWRGAAPIQRAIEAGDTETGVTIMQMDAGLDTGAMLLKRSCSIETQDNSADIYQKMSVLGPAALLETVDLICTGQTQAQQQDGGITSYARKLDKSEAEIDWGQSAEVIQRKIRAFNPAPVCFTLLSGERLRIHAATDLNKNSDALPGRVTIANNRITVACGEGQLQLDTVQLAGKKALSASEFLNGFGALLRTEVGLKQLGK
ncbi:MAG: methionyl-tRNA formyltransferase [Lentisphaeria bacterium]|jgi:methionyl-tRNA formyltransferase